MEIQPFLLKILNVIRKPDGGVPLGTIKIHPASDPQFMAALLAKFPNGLPAKPFVLMSYGNVNIMIDSELPEGDIQFVSYDGEIRILSYLDALKEPEKPEPDPDPKLADLLKPKFEYKAKPKRKKTAKRRTKKNASLKPDSV
jgi:hypothetical protein